MASWLHWASLSTVPNYYVGSRKWKFALKSLFSRSPLRCSSLPCQCHDERVLHVSWPIVRGTPFTIYRNLAYKRRYYFLTTTFSCCACLQANALCWICLFPAWKMTPASPTHSLPHSSKTWMPLCTKYFESEIKSFRSGSDRKFWTLYPDPKHWQIYIYCLHTPVQVFFLNAVMLLVMVSKHRF
jgi:hypothetical protein